ncbi:MAG: hypothetical protein HOM58_04245 [Rhodospirillaceae bacterium]|mgnify:CR=1 FL=1|jgi:hypothetical protein|nr:hypothetical protein [Rhodospirillaceae bacterium]MBT5455258.1 hypothetical protein [Rhodospirillaceae bacterium]
MHPVHANFIPPQKQQNQTVTQTTTVETVQPVPTNDTETASRALSDQIELSPEAVRFLESGDKSRGPQNRGTFAPPGHEKAAHSTAAQARAIIEADPSLAEQPFGQIVSQVARGVLSLADVTPDEEPGDDPAIDPAVGDGGEIPLADSTGGVILAPSISEETSTASPDQTDTPEPTETPVTNIIEPLPSSDELLLETPLTVASAPSVSDSDLIELLTEENIDQTA